MGAGKDGGDFTHYGLMHTSAYPVVDRISADKAACDENLVMLPIMERAALGDIHKRSG